MAIRVTILKGLEKKLRKALATGEGCELVLGEVVKLLDDEYTKRETDSREQAEVGLGYQELVSLFRFHLGDALALPPSPSQAWIIKNVALAKNMGVKKEHVEQICRGVRARYPRGPYELGWLLYNSPTLCSVGRGTSVSDVPGNEHSGAAELGVGGRPSRVFTGRSESDDD